MSTTSMTSQLVERPPIHPTNVWQQAWIMVKRNMIHTRRMPEMLSDVTIQPIMFVVLFAYVFGPAISAGNPAINYKQYLLPGIMGQTIVFTAFIVATGITADIEKGIIDRFRSLPIRRSAVLIGRSIASLLHSSIGIVVMALTGVIIGWRITTSVWEGTLGFLLVLAYSAFFYRLLGVLAFVAALAATLMVGAVGTGVVDGGARERPPHARGPGRTERSLMTASRGRSSAVMMAVATDAGSIHRSAS